MKKEKGITLIALIITIVIMLILVAVSITILIQSDLIGATKTAANATKDSFNKEGHIEDNMKVGNETLDEYLAKLQNENGGGEDEEPEDCIPKDEETIKALGEEFTKGYVGYYADIDGNGTVDGIIYADLAVGVSGQWEDDWGDYSYETVSDPNSLKNYYISQESYSGDFGTAPVLSATGTGNNRFYVMALKDVALDGTSTAERNRIYWNWYYNAYEKLDNTIPSTGEGSDDFGEGKIKTKQMISKWNEEESSYGAKNGGSTYTDLWGIFTDENNAGGTVDSSKWFVPSKGEWSAFGGNLGITKTNYPEKGLSDWYWSSSQFNTYSAYGAYFHDGYMSYDTVNFSDCVRLSSTF